MSRLLFGTGLVITLSLISCEAEEGDTRIRFGQLYLDRLAEQNVSERNFLEVSYEKLFTIPDTTSIFLYSPSPASVDSRGNLYVIDWSISKVLKFSPSGEYLVSYGEVSTGDGDGPGELLNINDFGMTSDSVVHVVDGYGFKVAFFAVDGTFLQEKKEQRQVDGYKRTPTGWEYIKFAGIPSPTLLESRFDEDVFEIIPSSSLVDEGKEGALGLGGTISIHNENVLYVFDQYPLILQYEPDGTLVYARTTIDYKYDFREPEVETLMLEGMPAYRNVGRYFHTGLATIENDKLYVSGVDPSEAPDKTIVIDVYDVRTGDYQHSMFPPEDGHFYIIYQNGRIYQAKDSTVVAWEVVY
ncbi:MAG: hypothetical protein F4069_01315 [Rhodothermaceae bacterium]|nr:hypothetical protein [Rhodothermaceae bacterium]MYG69816.1 hypothetical protein [Rhodothermaceae bacterium]MYJ43966.1 hypothetical protein [Rhodothermaceae bacterium]